MNQLNTYNDGVTSRRYTGFPLNSTLISSYTPDTIRSIINHAAAGKPYTTAVWIRVNRAGVQISAQDPQIARTRIPVFIPITLVNDIFMQPSINNVICIVYDEVKSNMKGVLLYVIHRTDAHLLREDFRLIKQSSYTKGTDNPEIINTNSKENKRLFSPGSQKSNDTYRNGKMNRQQSPRRILYIRDNETGTNREVTPSSGPPALPQLSYAPFKGSYHSNREDSGHRRHKSPGKNKTGHSSSKPSSDNGSKHRRKYRSRSPQKQVKPQLPVHSNSQDLTSEPTNQQQQEFLAQQQQQQLLVQQQMAAWQAAQQAPMIPMGIYNRYVPKTIPMATGETFQTTVPSSNTNGTSVAPIESPQETNGNDFTRSPSRSRSISPKRQDQQNRNRPLSAQNAEASSILIQSPYHQHHHHHHHRRHHMNGHSLPKPDSNMYNTISHSSRTRSKYPPPAINNNNNNNNTDNEIETKQYLKQLIDDMQSMKFEMNKIRLASSTGTTRGRSDTLGVSLNELRNDIDAIRARMAMTSKLTRK